MIVYGHSGSGKTTFLNKYFKEKRISTITIQCGSDMAFNQILLNAFDQLGSFYKQTGSVSETEGSKISGGVETKGFKSTGELSVSQTRVSGFARLVNPQLTPQRLAEALGAENKVLVIEDFHKLADEEKKKLADMLKVFIDQANKYPDLKVVCIGAVDTAREIVKLDNNLKQRVYECEIPLLTDAEIKEIVIRGCDLLNINMTTDLVERIVHYSNQLGALAHQLSYDVCECEGITRSQLKRKRLTGEKFANAVEGYIDARSDTLREVYDRAVKDPLGWYILRTFANRPLSKLSLKSISRKVNTADHPFSENEIALKLAELSTAEVGILRSDFNSSMFAVSDPFWGAFIKMRIAQEQAEREKAIKNSNNRNLQLQNQNDVESMLLHILLNKYNPNK
ncbi:MAG: ATP-binding protein [Bacteroidales bacterium]|nr:ATP-binding protein [Bacteroidales bacterium]